MHTTSTPYPKRRYSSASEPAVGDIVRMDDRDHDGNLIESSAFSEAVISEIRLGAIAVLYRPRAALVDGKIHLLAEVFECNLALLLERFHVCTTGWRGDKQSVETTRERCMRLADLEVSKAPHLARSISHRLCPCCGDLVVGVGGTYCEICTSRGLAA